MKMKSLSPSAITKKNAAMIMPKPTIIRSNHFLLPRCVMGLGSHCPGPNRGSPIGTLVYQLRSSKLRTIASTPPNANATPVIFAVRAV
jgi:hypothetical protein